MIDRLGHLIARAMLRAMTDDALRREVADALADQRAARPEDGVVARVAFWARELCGLGALLVMRPLRGRDAATDAMLTLLPGQTGIHPDEPVGRARDRADRQLARYPMLRGLPWEARWAAWAEAWPAISADPAIRRLRWIPLVAVMAAPFAALPWLVQASVPYVADGGLGAVAVVLLVIPLVMGLAVFVAGATVSVVTAPILRRRIGAYLEDALSARRHAPG